MRPPAAGIGLATGAREHGLPRTAAEVGGGSPRWAALAGYALVLVLGLVALVLLIGLPRPPTLPDHLPSAFALEVWLQSPGMPLDGVAEIGRIASWVLWGWAAASLLVELLLAVATS